MNTNTNMNLPTPEAPLTAPAPVAWIGLDWGHHEHAFALQDPTGQREEGTLPQSAESLHHWLRGLAERFGGRPVALALEASRGAVVLALVQYPWLTIYPIHPLTSARYRQAFTPSGATDDLPDARVLLERARDHAAKLRPLEPQDSQTVKLTGWVAARRHRVDRRTQGLNQRTRLQRDYYPQAWDLLGDGDIELAVDCLSRWPELLTLKAAKSRVIKRFYYAHNLRRPELLEARLRLIRQAVALPTDAARGDVAVLHGRSLLDQLRVVRKPVALLDREIKTVFAAHPEAYLFRDLPDAGLALAPRLCVAFGTIRSLYPESFSGAARWAGVARRDNLGSAPVRIGAVARSTNGGRFFDRSRNPNSDTHPHPPIETPPAGPAPVAWIGLDWGHHEHAFALQDPTGQREEGTLPQSAESLHRWLRGLAERFGGCPVALAIEASRGAVIHALLQYPWLTIYPLHLLTNARYRQAFTPSGATDDLSNARVLLELARDHAAKLRPLEPQDSQTVQLTSLVEARRHLVDRRTQVLNQLTSLLRDYYPQAWDLLGDYDTELAVAFLSRWPDLLTLKAAKPSVIKRFYYGHNLRRPELLEARLRLIRQAVALTTDAARGDVAVLPLRSLLDPLRVLRKHVALLDREIKIVFAAHPEAYLFRNLPGAGPALAPRLGSAFGTIRTLYPESFSGAARWADVARRGNLGSAPVRTGRSFARRTEGDFSTGAATRIRKRILGCRRPTSRTIRTAPRVHNHSSPS